MQNVHAGIGTAAADMPSVLSGFGHAENSLTRETMGAGLGWPYEPGNNRSISLSSGNRPCCFLENNSRPSAVISNTPPPPAIRSTALPVRSSICAFTRRAVGS